MEIQDCVVFILLSTLALSYGWGMRGLLIGGEKGAMVPGALFGLLFARFCGSAVVWENYWFLCAAGLMGMTFGGTEPYGETISMVALPKDPHYAPRHGCIGLMLKGALWFSVCGAFTAIAFAAMSGKYYPARDLIILICTLPAAQLAGYFIFNRPYDKKRGRFPKIYFSWSSREEWGANAGVLAELVIFALLHGETLSPVIAAFGFFFGAVGWAVAIWFYIRIVTPNKKGKYLFNALSKRKLSENWKTMEFTLGAFGGLGLSLGLCICREKVGGIASAIDSNGAVLSACGGLEKYMPAIMAVLMLGMALVEGIPFELGLKGKKVNSFVCDIVERPMFNLVPMLFVLLGSQFAAQIMTFFMLVYAIALKCSFDRFEDFKGLRAWQVILMGGSVLLFILETVKGPFTAKQTWFLCGAPYLIMDMIYSFRPRDISAIRSKCTDPLSFAQNVRLTVHLCFIIQIAALYAAAAIF